MSPEIAFLKIVCTTIRQLTCSSTGLESSTFSLVDLIPGSTLMTLCRSSVNPISLRIADSNSASSILVVELINRCQ